MKHTNVGPFVQKKGLLKTTHPRPRSKTITTKGKTWSAGGKAITIRKMWSARGVKAKVTATGFKVILTMT